MTPLLGFAPDMESPTSGMLVDCDQFVPYQTGMEAAPSPSTPTSVPVLLSDCRGAVVATKTDGTRRVIAGTTVGLYELSSGTWNNQSSATYTGGSDSRWSFAQFGDSTIASNRADAMQVSTSTTFSAVGGSAPKAQIVYAVGSQVMALNVNDGAEKTDGWHCCAIFDASDWVEAVATQSASGRLVSSPGPITAGMRLGEYATAYKAGAVYLGQYVGAPSVWDWLQVSGGDAGCVGKEAICDIDGAHFFVGTGNFWIFDGTRPVPIGDQQVRQWFFDNADSANLHKTKCVYDRQQNRVWIYYPSAGTSTCNSTLVYHLKSQQWGRANRAIEATLNYVSSGVTIDGLASISSTIRGLPDISFDSAYWLAGAHSLAIFNTSHQLQTYTGDPDDSSFTTGDAGDDDAVTLLKQIRLRFAAGRAPTTGSVSTAHKMSSGDSHSTGISGVLNDGKFDVMRSARWHRATVSFTGSVRVTGINPTFETAGER